MDKQTPRRVDDTERQAAVQRLTDGFGTGRLNPTEYDERLTLALGADSTGPLAPGGRPDGCPPGRAGVDGCPPAEGPA